MATDIAGREYGDVKQLGERFGVSPWTLRSWVYSGKVSSVKLGDSRRSKLLIPVAEVQRVFAESLRPAVSRK